MDTITAEKSAKSLTSNLYNDIQADILSGVFPDSFKLTEAAICKKYKVSRTPVREALRQLETDGLIEYIPNRGAFVNGLSKRDISDLFDLRTLLEVQAVDWAIKRMSIDDIESLRETLDFMEFYTLRKDLDNILMFNSMFHSILYAGTKDRMIQKTLSTYQTYLKHSLPAEIYSKAQLKQIFEEHRSIFEAVEAKNSAEGRSAMDHHMKQSKLRRLSNFL